MNVLNETLAIAAVLSTDRDLFLNNYNQYKIVKDKAKKEYDI